MKKQWILPFLLILSSSCQKYYLTTYQEKVDRDSLASTHVGSPDPRQKNPPKGEELILEWQIPKEILQKNPSIYLQVVYKDYSEVEKVYPIAHKAGYVVYRLVGEEFQKTKGLLAYKAELKTGDGEVFRTWQHQLFVNVIRLEEPQEETTQTTEAIYVPEDDEEESATFFPPTE